VAGEIAEARRRHFSFALKPAKGGYQVQQVIEHASRGEADKRSLTMVGRNGDGGAITLERELVENEVLDAASLKRETAKSRPARPQRW
jgi:hypothetical protein